MMAKRRMLRMEKLMPALAAAGAPDVFWIAIPMPMARIIGLARPI